MTFDVLFRLSPELILLVGACVVLILGATTSTQRAQWASPAALAVMIAALVMSIRLGDLSGGTDLPGLALTSLTFYVRWIALAVGILIVLVNWHQSVVSERGEYMALILFSVLGILLTASANDLIVLFFAIELVSIPTYILIALSREDARAAESSVKYFFLGALSAAILAYGLSFLYGAAGTTTIHAVGNEAALAHIASGASMSSAALIGLILVFAGLAFKIAAVPLHAYVADVYEGAASPLTGMLGFVPKFAGFVALVKIFGALGWDLPHSVQWMIWIVAAASMTIGNTLALIQRNVKRMLAYSSIAHTGYMLIALLVGPSLLSEPMSDGVAALLFYMAIYGVMNLGAFAALSSFSSGDRPVETLDDLSGLATRAPLAALGLAICAFSLMGFPPLAGFLGKLYVFGSAFSLSDGHPFQQPLIILAVIGVVNSAIGAAYYLRIVATLYMRPQQSDLTPAGGLPARWCLAACSLCMVLLFAWPTMLSTQSQKAAVALQAADPKLQVKTLQDKSSPVVMRDQGSFLEPMTKDESVEATRSEP